jgi:hypothetical protein
MPTYKYQPYYQYSGPTRAEPDRERLSEDDVEHRLTKFQEEISNFFNDIEVSIKTEPGNILCLTTEINKMDCDDRVKRCLNELDLYARKI